MARSVIPQASAAYTRSEYEAAHPNEELEKLRQAVVSARVQLQALRAEEGGIGEAITRAMQLGDGPEVVRLRERQTQMPFLIHAARLHIARCEIVYARAAFEALAEPYQQAQEAESAAKMERFRTHVAWQEKEVELQRLGGRRAELNTARYRFEQELRQLEAGNPPTDSRAF